MGVPAGLEIYIGEPITHASDRAVFDALVDYFRLRKIPGLILANFHIDGRQIDVAVIIERKYLVIEAKGYRNPVRGGSNGFWEVETTGGWKKFPNPYQQTLNATYALIKAMRSLPGHEGSPHPSAALLFVPGIPLGSEPYGDRKVSVGGLAGLPDRIADAKPHPWTLEQWRRFATRQRLERVERPEAACAPQVFAAEQLLAGYSTAFRATYGSIADLAELSCKDGELSLSSAAVAAQVCAGATMLLRGPSGCGKSLLAWRCSVGSLDGGAVPILLQAKDFAGRLKDTLEREASLLGMPRALDLVQAAALLGRRLLLIVDGYNECAQAQQERLSRSMQAFVRRYEAQLLVTSQIDLAKAELLPLRTVSVPEPDSTLKRAIAVHAAGGTLRPGLDRLLDSVSSCLEARLVGEARQGLAVDASRYALFDAYVRSRLGEDASEGIRILARLAGEMRARITFTLSVRERDRLVDEERDPARLLDILRRSNTLVQRGDRLSFRHEMFYEAFAAESLIRSAKGQAAVILSAMARPYDTSGKTMIVGAIDDEGLAQQVLAGYGNYSLLLACRAGECGSFARQWVQRGIVELLSVMRAEITQIGFDVGHGWDNIGIDPKTLYPWSPSQRALLVVLARVLIEGEHLDAVFEMVGAMDQRIAEGAARLRGDPRLRKGQSVHGVLFANAYVFGGTDSPGIAQFSVMTRSGSFTGGMEPITPSPELLAWLTRKQLSHGQKHLLLQLFNSMRLPPELYIDALCTWLASIRTYPQHLAMEMVHQTLYCARIGEPQRAQLIAELQEILSANDPVINSGVFESLERLGALDNDAQAHLPGVKEEIDGILRNPDQPLSWTQAFGLQVCCIDHPFASAYIEAIEAIPEADRKTLLRLACKGARNSSFVISMLIWDVARFNDPALTPAVSRWTNLPVLETAFQQDAVQAFVGAHLVMGQHNISLPIWDASKDSVAAAAMRACGVLYHWISRTEAESEVAGNAAVDAAWSVLLDHEAGAAAYALYLCERHGRYADKLPGSKPQPYIRAFYPRQLAEISRKALSHPDRQKAYYPHDYHLHDMLCFCIDILGEHGRSEDIPLLRELCDVAQLGRAAIDAIRKLELHSDIR